MTSHVLAPTGDVSSLNTTNTGGTNASCLSDANDGTFVSYSLIGGVDSYALVDMGTFTIGGTEYVKKAVATIRTALPGGGSPATIRCRLESVDRNTGSVTILGGYTSYVESNFSPTDHVISLQVNFDGVPVQNQIDQVRLRIVEPWSSLGVANVYKAAVDVQTSAYPTASGITSVNFSTPRPILAWTFADSDGDAEYFHRVKVFTQTQTTTAGFDPNTTSPQVDSGNMTVATSGYVAGQWQPAVALPINIALLAYVQVGEATGWPANANGTAAPTFQAAGWFASSAFTITVVPPGAPVLTAADDPNNVSGGPRVNLTVLTQNNMFVRTQVYITSPGTPWLNNWAALQTVATTVIGFNSGLPITDILGSGFMRVTNSSAGVGDLQVWSDGSGVVGGSTVADEAKAMMPVIAGRNYAFCTQVLAFVTGRVVTPTIDWFNAAGAFLSTSTGSTTTDSAAAWKGVSMSAAAPANSAFARTGLKFAATAAGEQHAWNASVFRPYDDGETLTGDGVIHPYGAGFGTGTPMLGSGEIDYEAGGAGGQIYTGAVTNGTIIFNDTVSFKFGARSAKITTTTGGLAGLSWSLRPIPQGVTGVTMGAVAWVKTSVNMTAYVQLQFYDINQNLLLTVNGASITATSAGFLLMSVSGVPPTNAAYVAVAYYAIATAGAQTINLDGTALYYTPQTSTRRGTPMSTGLLDSDTGVSVILVEKSYDGGTTWSPVRFLNNVYASGVAEPQSLSVSDYEIIQGLQVKYRASVFGYFVGIPIQSAYSAIQTVTPAVPSATSTSRWWLKDVTTPTNSIQIDFLDDGNGLQYDIPEESAVFSPVGRTRKFVVADKIKGHEFTVTGDFITTAVWNAFLNIRNQQEVLLLQRPWTSEQWYVRLDTNLKTKEMNTNPIRYLADFTMVEVDVPT